MPEWAPDKCCFKKFRHENVIGQNDIWEIACLAERYQNLQSTLKCDDQNTIKLLFKAFKRNDCKCVEIGINALHVETFIYGFYFI